MGAEKAGFENALFNMGTILKTPRKYPDFQAKVIQSHFMRFSWHQFWECKN